MAKEETKYLYPRSIENINDTVNQYAYLINMLICFDQVDRKFSQRSSCWITKGLGHPPL